MTITKMRKLNYKGFSLVELMVVVAIIGILSAVAIPNFNRFQRRARTAEGKSALGGVYQASKAFMSEYEAYSSDLVAIGYSTDGELRYNTGFGIASVYPASYPAMAVRTGLNRTEQLCGDATYGANCLIHPQAGGWAALPAGSMADVAGVNPTFTAVAAGMIGGSVDDQWSINHSKQLTLLQDGTAN